MTLKLRDREINTVGLIDDDDDVRRGYRYSTDDLNLNASDVDPIRDIDASISDFNSRFDAIICDYNLKTKNYSSVNGDEVCVRLYKKNLPAVLCTRFDGSLPSQIRKNRRHIPVVIAPKDLDADLLLESLEVCVDEFSGKFIKTRKPYRALLRIEGGDVLGGGEGILVLHLLIPSWDPGHMFTMEIDRAAGEAYDEARRAVDAGVVTRMFGTVNIGSESVDDLFISEWRLS
ncbi:hypothetical protein QYY77_12440 [Xanthomonas campestris pv. campestris]|uniref:hypothetical protein n=1 Tax=Xanthomonas campestris TaxID=339 RepID=UPI002AD5784E|nr:hypothetical protein [Xanthomonas campestris]MEA0736878.1 hypothetical protein [Xanthomonas campestris pv. campestris]